MNLLNNKRIITVFDKCRSLLNSFNISLVFSFCALFISAISFYFQFLYEKKEVIVTPLLPERIQNNKVRYKLIAINTGNSTVILANIKYTIDPNDHEGLNKKRNGGLIPSLKLNMVFDDDEKISTIALTPTSYKELVFTLEESVLATKDEKGVYNSNQIRFSFDIIDLEGQLIQTSLPACTIPKIYDIKTTVTNTETSTVRPVELIGMKTEPNECNKDIKLL
jgi:hypothetical protein